MSEDRSHTEQAPSRLKPQDTFLELRIGYGPKFYDGKKPTSNQEMAELLKSRADHSPGIVRELFLMLSDYYSELKLEAYQVIVAGDETGSFTGSLSVSFGACGSCKQEGGQKGMAGYIDGVYFNCAACEHPRSGVAP
jgi:hypothetical protein